MRTIQPETTVLVVLSIGCSSPSGAGFEAGDEEGLDAGPCDAATQWDGDCREDGIGAPCAADSCIDDLVCWGTGKMGGVCAPGGEETMTPSQREEFCYCLGYGSVRPEDLDPFSRGLDCQPDGPPTCAEIGGSCEAPNLTCIDGCDRDATIGHASCEGGLLCCVPFDPRRTCEAQGGWCMEPGEPCPANSVPGSACGAGGTCCHDVC